MIQMYMSDHLVERVEGSSVSSVLGAWLSWSSIGVDDSTLTRSCGCGGVATEHGDTRAKLGASKRNHVLANMDGDLLSLLLMSVHEDPLNEIVAVLITSNVD